MWVLALAVLVTVCVDAMPERRQPTYFLHSTPQEGPLERLKRKTIEKMQHNMGRLIEEINEGSGVTSAYQGDILFTKDELEQMETRSKRQAMRDLSRRWSNNTVPYIFYHPDEKAKNAFKKAAQLWNDNTCINFKEYSDPRTSGIKPPTDFLYLAPGDGCFSHVGKIGPGPQELILGTNCETVGIAAHEIGHTLGFFHTQARYDRDNYITVDENNVKSGWTRDFDKQDETYNNNYGITYDFGSIMHYGSKSPIAAKDTGKPIITAKDGNYTATLGSDIISFYDFLMMNKLYDCLDKCDPKPDCKNEGFPNPHDCSKCICPSGFGGPLCDEKPSSCGKELEATSDWLPIEETLDAGEEGEEQDEFKRCTYWIKAPDNVNNARIEVKIAELPEEFNKDGCIYAGVEIKANEDIRLTGYRFCSQDDIGTELSSNSKIVPVILYSGSRTKPFSTKLEYRYTS